MTKLLIYFSKRVSFSVKASFLTKHIKNQGGIAMCEHIFHHFLGTVRMAALDTIRYEQTKHPESFYSEDLLNCIPVSLLDKGIPACNQVSVANEVETISKSYRRQGLKTKRLEERKEFAKKANFLYKIAVRIDHL